MADPTEGGLPPTPPTEAELLRTNLGAVRDALVWKVEGLDEADRRRPMTPTGTNLIGAVKHLTWIEGWYLCEFFGRERPNLAWEWQLDGQWGHHSQLYATPEETTDELIDAYRATSAAADRAIDELGLDAVGRHWSGEPVVARCPSGNRRPSRWPAARRADGGGQLPVGRAEVATCPPGNQRPSRWSGARRADGGGQLPVGRAEVATCPPGSQRPSRW